MFTVLDITVITALLAASICISTYSFIKYDHIIRGLLVRDVIRFIVLAAIIEEVMYRVMLNDYLNTWNAYFGLDLSITTIYIINSIVFGVSHYFNDMLVASVNHALWFKILHVSFTSVIGYYFCILAAYSLSLCMVTHMAFNFIIIISSKHIATRYNRPKRFKIRSVKNTNVTQSTPLIIQHMQREPKDDIGLLCYKHNSENYQWATGVKLITTADINKSLFESIKKYDEKNTLLNNRLRLKRSDAHKNLVDLYDICSANTSCTYGISASNNTTGIPYIQNVTSDTPDAPNDIPNDTPIDIFDIDALKSLTNKQHTD